MICSGVSELSQSELIAVLLQSGSKEMDVLELSHTIMNEYGMEKLSKVTIEELKKVHGIGTAKACKIVAAIELGKRVNRHQLNILNKVSSPRQVADFFQNELRHENRELFIIALLNTKNEIISHEIISIGTLSMSLVHPREVFNRAIKRSAAGIILIHNHPSGHSEPSEDDRLITRRLSEVGELIGIKVVDHVVIGHDNYYSFRENGEF